MRWRTVAALCIVLGGLLNETSNWALGQETSAASATTGDETSQIDGLTHVVVGPRETLREALEKLTTWLPWQPSMFDAGTVLWVDFNRLPEELKELGHHGHQTHFGVDLYALQVSCMLDEAETGDLDLFWATSWQWPANPKLSKLYYDLLRAKFGLRGQDQDIYQQLLANGHGWLAPRVLTLAVWIGNVADRQTYENNLNAELLAWEEQERLDRTLAIGVFSETSSVDAFLAGGESMSMLLGDGCGITNNAAPFAVVVNAETNGQMTVTWESCSTHLYGVYSREDLVTGSWQAQLWMIGLDGTSSWTDTNAPALNHCFYKVRRLTLDGDDDDGDDLSNLAEFNTYGTDPGNPDTDGDGMPDGWELQYGFKPLDPSDGSLDFDGDGVSNSAEYVQGRDPTSGAVADLNNAVNLVVFTPME